MSLLVPTLKPSALSARSLPPTPASLPLPVLAQGISHAFDPARDLTGNLTRDAIISCERCPRLRTYCTGIATVRRRAYQDHVYWGRPVPGFGDIKARILIAGLAPGAHGANRTGRPFTGDGSGAFMYPVLHEVGLATRPQAINRYDGLRLRHTWIASVVRCAPPGDKPLPAELRNCATHFANEVGALTRLRVVVALGRIAWDGFLAYLLLGGVIARRSNYPFAHGAEYLLPNGFRLLATYHPSLRNTNTGRLDRVMFTRIFVRARELAGLDPQSNFSSPSITLNRRILPNSTRGESV